MPHGGHFGSLETPELLVEDIRKFGRKFRLGAGLHGSLWRSKKAADNKGASLSGNGNLSESVI